MYVLFAKLARQALSERSASQQMIPSGENTTDLGQRAQSELPSCKTSKSFASTPGRCRTRENKRACDAASAWRLNMFPQM
jgi:hypothetical protein